MEAVVIEREPQIEEFSCCDASLLELRNALAREVDDEHHSSERYREAAKKLDVLQYPEFSKTLTGMSEDEFQHYLNLTAIVELLNEDCRCIWRKNA